MQGWNPICRAMFDGDSQAVVEFVQMLFDIEISNDTAVLICDRWQKFNPKSSWNTSTGPAMWIKSRLKEMFVLPRHHGETIGDATAAIMHCFFLSLQETQEMLARLKNENKLCSTVARSKISRTPKVIQPIDGTAAIVAPVE